MRHLLAALAICLGTGAHAGCLDAPDPCETPMGSYHIVLPDGATGQVPALMFLHGAGGSGASAVRPGGMARAALERGYAVIGPNGLDRPGRFRTGWSFHPDRPAQRDEMAFLTGVRDDAARRFGIDPSRVILAGFSIGGSMTSYIACADPTAVTGRLCSSQSWSWASMAHSMSWSQPNWVRARLARPARRRHARRSSSPGESAGASAIRPRRVSR